MDGDDGVDGQMERDGQMDERIDDWMHAWRAR